MIDSILKRRLWVCLGVMAGAICGLSTPGAEPPKLGAEVLQVEGGKVRGVVTNEVLTFKGVPYAAPPIGSLRWRNPRPVVSWQGIREAANFGPSAPQTDAVSQSEDCLTLNVWRPALESSNPRAVMVWFHGGAMVHGGPPLYPMERLARQDVVVVSVTFRLGRLGHFAHPALAQEAPDEPRGNYGFMDQRAALQWVQRNIAAFGGDPGRVTIFGESAGGGSVLAHLVSPLSRGLFHRAILQSPGTPGPRAGVIPSTKLEAAERIAIDWARSAGVTGEGEQALEQLRDLPIQTVLQGTSSKEVLVALSQGRTPPGMAMSIIDGRFLPETIEAALAGGRLVRVPVLVGANSRDLPSGSAADKEALFALFGAEAEAARRAYDPFGDQSLEELQQQVFADRSFVEPVRYFADAMTRAGNPVWLYRFAYVSDALRGRDKGTLHGFEIPFALNVPAAIVGEAKVTPADRQMAATASACWVQFAKNGDPNGTGRPAWPRHEPGRDRLLHFTTDGVVVGTDPIKERVDLWTRVWEATARDPGKEPLVPVTIFNFARAETDLYFGRYVELGRFGKLGHSREMTDVDKQDVVRMNRDTIYSSGVFDLEASPLTVRLPDSGKRFMSMQVVSQDHHTLEVRYRAGRYSYTQGKVGSRYVFLIIRILANPMDSSDMDQARRLQDEIQVDQAEAGAWTAPRWDSSSRDRLRQALAELGATTGAHNKNMFGSKHEVDPVLHLIGTAIGWGGNPRSAAIYQSYYPSRNDGKTPYTLTLRDVPVDGFWSISVYDAKGYFQRNEQAAYSWNSLTAKPNPDGTTTISFGGVPGRDPNVLPISEGWNYTARLYRPRRAILDGSWSMPEAQVAR
ncbi:MAG: carboxylesterase family protein [Verrucomicrobiales bacterium]|nr:carboxylesterase family protein [Verrucomicrobiales bacterium]